MKSLRRSICMALSLCLVAIAAAGCGKTDSSSSSTAETTKAGSSDSSSETKKETVKLTFWTAGTAQDDQSRITDAVNKYLKDTLNSNIQIDYQELGWGSSDYDPKLSNALATGQEVDVVFTAGWVGNFQLNALSGNFISLDDYLTKYPELVEILSQDFIDATKINGTSYALPCNKEKFHSWGYLVNTELAEKYNMDLTKIKSEKDMEPLFDTILENEPGIYPLCVANMDVPGYKFLDWDNISDDDVPGAFYPSNEVTTEIVNQFSAPESVAFYKNMKTYLAKKYIRTDAPTLSSVTDELKTAKYFAAVSQLKPGKDAEMTAGTNIKWTQVQITEDAITNRETTGALLAIPKASKHPDEAMEFIKLLYTDADLLNLFIFGEEDVDYTKNADGTVALIEGSGYASSNGWRFGDQTKNHRLSFEAADKYDQWKEIDATAPKRGSLGFIFDNTAVDTQTLISNTRAVTQEYYKTLFLGQAPDVDAMVEEMDNKYKAAGLDDLLKIMSEQYETFLSSK